MSFLRREFEEEEEEGMPQMGMGREEEVEEDCDSCDTLKAISRTNSKFARVLQQGKKKGKKGREEQGEAAEDAEVDGYGILEEEYVSPHMDEKGEWRKDEGPTDFYELGSSTWNLLHTMAAYYPSRPSKMKQEKTKTFLETLPHVYPCRHCADDLQKEMAVNPPKVTSRKEFAQWMCDTHNAVNVKLGKPIFDCSLVDQRWRFVPEA